jgi:hypothetical protein
MKKTIFLTALAIFIQIALFGQKRPVELRWEYTAIPETKNEYECSLLAKHFDDLISLQFTIRWTPENTTFLKFAPGNLPDLNKKNINASTADQGFIRFIWVDLSLSGKSLAPGTPIFSIHVKTNGAQPDLRLDSKPLEIEIIDKDEIIRHLIVE